MLMSGNKFRFSATMKKAAYRTPSLDNSSANLTQNKKEIAYVNSKKNTHAQEVPGGNFDGYVNSDIADGNGRASYRPGE